MTFDASVQEAVAELNKDRPATWAEAEAFAVRMRKCKILALVAFAANTTEEKTVSALLLRHTNTGDATACRIIARAAFRP